MHFITPNPHDVVYYTSADSTGTDATWSVYREEYDRSDLDNPIEGSTIRIGSWPSEAAANEAAELLWAHRDSLRIPTREV